MSGHCRAQVLVIGSGPGGAVTAWTLSAHGREVLVLEEGPQLTLDSCSPFSIQEMRQKYRCGGLNPALGTPKIPFVEGCCVGGGSEINSALYHRTPAEILELWRYRYSVRHLEPADLLPHFEACEAALSVQLNPGQQPGPAVRMRLGAERLGWHNMEVPRWIKYEQRVTPSGAVPGRRQSMTETLIPLAQRAGCRLMPETRAQRLLRESGRWRVEVVQHGRMATVEADAVFICGGAVQTAALLLRSGIQANIGRSLAMHPTVKVVACFEDEINDNCDDVPAQQVKEFSPFVSMGCSISSLPYLALAMTDHPESGVQPSREWRRMAIYYAMITGPNTGIVRALPFSRDPLVQYRLSPADLRGLAFALDRLCRLLLAGGASRLYPSIVGFGPPLRREDDLSRIPSELLRRSTNLVTIHLFSSCPMGEDRTICATNSFGAVHGHGSLFVNDASLLCTAPGVNPQGSIMAVARRNAMHFLKAL